jgi:hypothetical protein
MSDLPSTIPEASTETIGRQYEGWAFTFCKAAFLALLFGRYTLLMTAGLSTLFYVLAQAKGVREWRCFLKPPWVTIFWAAIFVGQCYFYFARHGR